VRVRASKRSHLATLIWPPSTVTSLRHCTMGFRAPTSTSQGLTEAAMDYELARQIKLIGP
jgi:hypothetical protein